MRLPDRNSEYLSFRAPYLNASVPTELTGQKKMTIIRNNRTATKTHDLPLNAHLVELQYGLHQVQHVVAPLQEGVEPDEEGAVLEAPRVGRALLRRLRLVVEVGALERDAVLEAHLEVLHRVLGLLDVLEERLAADEVLRLCDDGVAQLPHEHDKPGRGVVEPGQQLTAVIFRQASKTRAPAKTLGSLQPSIHKIVASTFAAHSLRMLPDEQNRVHRRLEERNEVGEGLAAQGVDVAQEGLEVHEVVVGLHARLRHLLAEPVEGGEVGALGHLRLR